MTTGHCVFRVTIKTKVIIVFDFTWCLSVTVTLRRNKVGSDLEERVTEGRLVPHNIGKLMYPSCVPIRQLKESGVLFFLPG